MLWSKTTSLHLTEANLFMYIVEKVKEVKCFSLKLASRRLCFKTRGSFCYVCFGTLRPTVSVQYTFVNSQTSIVETCERINPRILISTWFKKVACIVTGLGLYALIMSSSCNSYLYLSVKVHAFGSIYIVGTKLTIFCKVMTLLMLLL